MLSLPAPPYAAGDTYAACITDVRDADLRRRLRSDSALIEDADARHSRAGLSQRFDQLSSPNFQMVEVDADEMEWLYDRFATKATTVDLYESLKTSAPHERCALCGVRDATSLDHYLPKSTFPSLAVNPLNLIPACGRCNQLKSTRMNTTVHAYFDTLGSDLWLAARVIESKPCVVLFAIEPPSSWSASLADRARKHFKAVGLSQLYAGQASRTLRGEAVALSQTHASEGHSGVNNYVARRSESWSDLDPNCWEAAMYRAMAQSDWFCDGGFELG